MGQKILIVSIVVFIAILLSSFIVGVKSSAVRIRRQSENDGHDPFGEVAPERGTFAPTTLQPGDGNASPSSTTVASSLSTTPEPGNTTQAMPSTEDSGSASVAVTVVIVVLVVALVAAIAIFVILRVRRRRMADYEKKTQIQMSSTSNAGVYIDLTSAPAGDKEKPAESPEQERLNTDDD